MSGKPNGEKVVGRHKVVISNLMGNIYRFNGMFTNVGKPDGADVFWNCYVCLRCSRD